MTDQTQAPADPTEDGQASGVDPSGGSSSDPNDGTVDGGDILDNVASDETPSGQSDDTTNNEDDQKTTEDGSPDDANTAPPTDEDKKSEVSIKDKLLEPSENKNEKQDEDNKDPNLEPGGKSYDEMRKVYTQSTQRINELEAAAKDSESSKADSEAIKSERDELKEYVDKVRPIIDLVNSDESLAAAIDEKYSSQNPTIGDIKSLTEKLLNEKFSQLKTEQDHQKDVSQKEKTISDFSKDFEDKFATDEQKLEFIKFFESKATGGKGIEITSDNLSMVYDHLNKDVAESKGADKERQRIENVQNATIGGGGNTQSAGAGAKNEDDDIFGAPRNRGI